MYGKRYILPFKNRRQTDIFRAEIWQKDYAESTVTVLEGSEVPVMVEWSNTDINLNEPINPLEITLSFLNQGLTIEDFYSNDDEAFRIDFYFQSFADGTGTERILFTTYLVQDGVTESLTDQTHVINLKSTDNLALIKNFKWNETYASYDDPIGLGGYIREALQTTGLFSHDTTTPMSLPLRIFDNLFENSEDDRSDDPLNDPMGQTIVYPNSFQNDDESFLDCYEILTRVLNGKNATILQADGFWNVIRIPEYQLFTDGEIPGTQTEYNGSGTDFTAVTLEPLVEIGRNAGDVQPIAEDQLKTLQRSVRYVQNEFNYNTPITIRQADLQIPPGAIPYDTTTDGDLRYDKYDLATYFPDWVQRNGDTSYLVIVTDTSTDPEQETDRYIVKPSDFDNKSGVQFNPIVVSKDDTFEFSLQFKTFHSDGFFWVIFVLITESGDYYSLDLNPGTGEIAWQGPASIDNWYTDSDGIRVEKDGTPDSWHFWDINEFQELPILIPESGILLIQVDGNSSTTEGGFGTYETSWKDIRFELSQYVNQSTQIVGQVHTNTEPDSLSKKIEEGEVFIDDSPRNTIGGTMFTSALTAFGGTDIPSGEDTLIGNVYFTRTNSWHRAELVENRRLGDIITAERLSLKRNTRLIIDGTFRNVRYDEDKFISPLCLFTFLFYPGRYFVASSMKIDYMNCTFNARLIEIYNTADVVATEVYLYGDKELETGVINGMIEFDNINYFNSADDYLTPSLSNSRFTYAGFTTTLDISVILYVPISGSGTATFNLLKNGSTIATDTVNAVQVFKRIDFLLPAEAIASGDYIEVEVDTGGATVNIQSGSINLTVNNAVVDNLDYLFKFKYDVKQ